MEVLSMMARISTAVAGLTLSRLVYGTWRLLDDPATATTADLVRRLHVCLDLGITTLDTAEIYGGYRVEEFLGAAFRQEPRLRERFEIVTKCGIYVPNAFHPERTVAFYNAEAARLVKSAEKSLRLLGTDRVEMLLVHRPDWLTGADETADGMNRLIAGGKVRAAGVSNYNVHQFELLNARVTQPLVTNQVEFSLLHMDPIHDGTADQCQRLRIHPMAWSPLKQGALMDPSQPASARLHALAIELGRKHGGASLDQLAYAWVLAHPARPLPIIGTNRIERLQAAAMAAEIRLDREDWYALWTAAQGRTIP
jgi:predicted oxidoreductase